MLVKNFCSKEVNLEGANNTISSIEDLNKYLSNLVRANVDVQDKNNQMRDHIKPRGVDTPVSIHSEIKDGNPVISCLITDRESVDWSNLAGYASDAAPWEDEDIETAAALGIRYGVIAYIDDQVDNTKKFEYSKIELPITKQKLNKLIKKAAEDQVDFADSYVSDEIYQYVIDNISEKYDEYGEYDEMKERKCTGEKLMLKLKKIRY